jgi:hypothetical protein
MQMKQKSVDDQVHHKCGDRDSEDTERSFVDVAHAVLRQLVTLLAGARVWLRIQQHRIKECVAGVNYELPSTTITSPHPGS